MSELIEPSVKRFEDLLTPDELVATKRAAELWGTLNVIVGDGPSREADLRELMYHIHAIQRAIMAQAACRAYPQLFRLLGEELEETRQGEDK
jgi:hypothetical protein